MNPRMMGTCLVWAFCGIGVVACGSDDDSGTGPAGASGSPGASGNAGSPGGGGTAGQGAAGAAGGASIGDACELCQLGPCSEEYLACQASQECKDVAACVGDCADTACLQQCYLDHPAGATLFGPLARCTMTNCATECGVSS